jgi:hypothetical protein
MTAITSSRTSVHASPTADDHAQSGGLGGGGAGAASSQVPAVALTTLAEGALGVLDATVSDAGDAALLRAMGLFSGALVRVCRQGSPCIVAVMTPAAGVASGTTARLDEAGVDGGDACAGCACGGSRIGLAHELARRVMVRPVKLAS